MNVSKMLSAYSKALIPLRIIGNTIKTPAFHDNAHLFDVVRLDASSLTKLQYLPFESNEKIAGYVSRKRYRKRSANIL